MTWRIWTVLLVVLVVGAWLLMVPFTPPPSTKTAAMIDDYRTAGLMPATGAFTVSDKVGHDVFEIPATDAQHLAEEMASMGDMAMDMGATGDMQAMPDQAEMPMAGETEAGHAEDGPAMDMGASGDMQMTGEPAGTGSDMAMGETEAGHADTGAQQEGMKMDMAPEAEHAEAADEAGHGGGGPMVGISIVAQGSADDVAMAAKRRKIARTVEIDMSEWGYSPGRVMVEPGEVIRLVIRNAGNIPHEFMFMGMAAMNAVTYRIQRADWNLVEHEAISEMAIVLPEDSFEMVVEVHKPGAWMFMCMFPYHMQMGMMGVLMTEGASMDMGGMKM